MKAVVALALMGVASGTRGAPVRTTMEPDVTVFESANWNREGRVSEEEMMTVEFWLKHDAADVADFAETLMRLATPGTEHYGAWLSTEEVVAKLSPSREATDAALDFAVNAMGARDVHVTKDGGVIKATARARDVEKALETRLYHHSHTTYTKVDVVRCVEAYSLPAHVARHVSFVGELVRFPAMRFAGQPIQKPMGVNASKVAKADDAWSTCGTLYDTYVNPAVLAERYGFEFPFASSAPSNSLAVAEFQGEYYDDEDLTAFSTQCGLSSPVTIAATIGGNTPKACDTGLEPCIESLLDIEYAGAIAGDVPLTVIYSTTYSLSDFASTLADMDTPPLVTSVSYGNDEAQQTSSSFMDSVSTQFMKLGAQGLTILFAAGDQGVWGREGLGATYHPDFPGGSPYVTAVGGTDFATKTTIGEETTWADGGSGFSDEFDAPSFQTDEIATYLAATDVTIPKDSMYNADGRGYPDVSALAGEVNPYFISFKDGSYSAVAGTSAACPVVAAMIAQINDARLAAGKPSMGFLNPFLYATGEAGGAFNDVTTGITSGGLTGGFPARAGWDAATGYGTIIFDKLKAAALAAAN